MTQTPDHEMFPITMADGTITERRADTIRMCIALGFKDGQCAVCGKEASKQGQGPHMNAHKRLIGDAPPRPKRDTRPKKRANKVMDEAAEAARLRKTDPVKPTPPTVDEACAALLHAMGVTSVPTAVVADVAHWFNATGLLIQMCQEAK